MMNNKGQMIGFGFIIGIVMLVVAVLLITSFWPTIQDQFDGLRHQDELNCKSTKDICGGIGSNTTCYNVSVGNEHTTTCAMLSIGPPLILIMLILGAVGLIMRGDSQQQAPQYPSYPGY
ncbi:hypothetical protein LCGC14_2374810 [marine sediment metagenome]|uniref:Transmembrane protein n=1 Tax=marine sediment metagenome TaxID=412755 RepID=A0A0F9EF38_9ZZZZ